MTARFGSFAIFFTPKRFEPRPSFLCMSKYRNSRRDSKNSKFFSQQVFQIFDSKHGSPENYSDFFFFTFSSSRSRAMRSPRHNFSKILSNRNEISQTCSGVNVVVPNTFWVHSVQGFRSWGTSKWKNFAMLFQGRISNYLNFLMNYILLKRNGSTRARNVILSWLEWQARMVDSSCKIILIWRHRSEREAINPKFYFIEFLKLEESYQLRF